MINIPGYKLRFDQRTKICFYRYKNKNLYLILYDNNKKRDYNYLEGASQISSTHLLFKTLLQPQPGAR